MYKNIIIDKLDAMGVKYINSGQNFLLSQCLNPSHNDNKPSFSINTETGFCKCFGCGYVLDSSFFTEGALDEEQIEEMARRSMYSSLERNKIDEKKSSIFLPPVGGEPEKNYRGLSESIIKSANLYRADTGKYADRIIFPFNQDGKPLGFTSRALDNSIEPKYLHNWGFSAKDILYPYDLIKESGTSSLVITEGVIDCLSSWELGIPAMCNFGVAFNFTPHKIKTLLGLGIEELIICLDKDKAGIKGTFGEVTDTGVVIGMLNQELLLDNFKVSLGMHDSRLYDYYHDTESKDLNDFICKRPHHG